jgi:hypothetical protein
MRPVRPGGMERDGSREPPLAPPCSKHRAATRARGRDLRFRERRAETWRVRAAMPFATLLRRATARDERGPFRAPSPRFTVVDRSCLRRTETSSGNAAAARELHPTFPSDFSGDPGYARDTYEWSPLSRRGQAWCPITSLSSTHVRVSTSRHPHVPRSTHTMPRRRHANRSPLGAMASGSGLAPVAGGVARIPREAFTSP